MDQPVFDAASFVAFDLEKGQISTRVNNGLALIPLNILAAMEPTDAVINVAREFGRTHGQDLRDKKESGTFGKGFQILAQHLTGTLATLGLGRLTIEIHGNALIFRLTSTEIKEGCNGIITGFLGGYLEAVTGKRFEVIVLEENNDNGLKTLWAGNPSAAAKILTQIEDGVPPMLVLEQMGERSAS